MKNFFYFYFFFINSFLFNCFSQSDIRNIDSLIHLITVESYSVHFDSLRTSEFCNRKVLPYGTQSTDHNACRDYIFRYFTSHLGSENVFLHHFKSNEYKGLCNVIGVKHGTNNTAGIWVISAHYDSNNNLGIKPMSDSVSPGANDNGTGLAAILEITRIIASINTESTIIFAAWDFEEVFTYGLPTGSNAWFKEHVSKKATTSFNQLNNGLVINIKDLKGNINFDMFGNPQKEEDGIPILWACYAKNQHIEFVNDYVKTFNKYIPEIKAITHGKLTLSDHYTFAFRKIPAVENLESNFSADPYYHTCLDNLDNENNIDFEYATNVTRGGLAYILEKNLMFIEKKE